MGSDGAPNSQEIDRDGVRQLGLVRGDLGLTWLGKGFQPLSIEANYIYDFGVDTLIDGIAQGDAATSTRILYGLKIDGLGFERPLPGFMKINVEDYLTGKNVQIAPSILTIELSYYVEF